jgi:F0F1-type ATP synthase assembly protein I
MNTLLKLAIVSLVLLAPSSGWAAQESTDDLAAMKARLDSIEDEARKLESRIDKVEGNERLISGTIGGYKYSFSFPSSISIGLLIGCFCALWAQNTRRNPWLWFFMGGCFAPITLFVLLAKNSEHQRLVNSRQNP